MSLLLYIITILTISIFAEYLKYIIKLGNELVRSYNLILNIVKLVSHLFNDIDGRIRQLFVNLMKLTFESAKILEISMLLVLQAKYIYQTVFYQLIKIRELKSESGDVSIVHFVNR
jgi:hypothetical protein